jgi:hypothetical protein
MYVGIICACLPCLKAFTRHLFPSLFRHTPESRSNENVKFSVFSVIPVQLRSIRRRQRQEDEDLYSKGTTATSSHQSSNLSDQPTVVGDLEGNYEELDAISRSVDCDGASKQSVAETRKIDQASIV